jgi:hypothetical protein
MTVGKRGRRRPRGPLPDQATGAAALLLDTMAEAEPGKVAELAAATDRVLEQVANSTHGRALAKLEEAEKKAWLSLAGYKFVMFGYWCGQWVLLKTVLGTHRTNPFASACRLAQEVCKQRGWKDKTEEKDNG